MKSLRVLLCHAIGSATLCFAPCLVAQEAPAAAVAQASDQAPMWDVAALAQPPKTTPADPIRADGLKAIFFDGLPFHDKPTRVFAWLGLPKLEAGKKAPGIVLVHGGGGTAFEDWARLWVGRGYAAIAFDTCGAIPLRAAHGEGWQRHDAGGPSGWGGFSQMNEAREDHWTYHAVADGILANSLLRSLPEVDADRIGVTGIS